MGILDSVFALERRGWGNADDRWYAPIGALSPSKAGVYVNDESAMRCAAVYACVRVLAESVASLPAFLYRRLPDGGRERATDHWAYNLIHQEPHPQISPCQFFETMVMHLALAGNHYSKIQTMNNGSVRELTPLNPRNVDVNVLPSGRLQYVYKSSDGKERVYSDAEILHVPGMSWDGLKGMSPLSYARETIGLSIAAEEFGSRLFADGLNPGHIFTLPEGTRLSAEQTNKLRDDLREQYAGLKKSHSGMVIPSGMTFSQVGISPEDSQFLETRKFQVEEIARIFRIPLHMVQAETKSTSWGSGIESLSRGFVIYTLRPWLVRIEQTLNRRLLTGEDRNNYYFEFLVDALLRGDEKSRAEYFVAAVQNGWLSRNEVRQIENRNPVEGGDKFLVPLNMAVAGEPPPEPADDGDEPRSVCACGHEHRAEPRPAYEDHPRLSIQRSYRRVIADAMSRVIRRERSDIMRGAEKHLRKLARKGEVRTTETFARFIDEFYSEHREFVREAIRPAFTALAEAVGAAAMREIEREWRWSEDLEQWLEDFIETFSNSYTGASRGQLAALLGELEDEFDDVIDTDVIIDGFSTRFDEWEAGGEANRPRSDRIAAYESVRLGQGFARAAFFAAGIGALVWVATGSETCPYCRSLDGKRVGPDEFFVSAGEEFQPSGAESPLVPSLNIGHPPVHNGCDCMLIPGL